MVTAAKALLPVALGILFYSGFYVGGGLTFVLLHIGPETGITYRVVSRICTAIYYPLLAYNAHRTVIVVETGTIDESVDGTCLLRYPAQRLTKSGVFVDGVDLRVPAKLASAVTALKGKKVKVSYGHEIDPEYFGSEYPVLTSIEPSP